MYLLHYITLRFDSYNMSQVCEIATSNVINSMFYADYSQVYVTIIPKENPDPIISKLESCTEYIRIWMERIFLILNDSKTEFVIFVSRVKFNNLSVSSMTVGDCKIPIAISVKNLGVMLDSLLNMDNFVKYKVKSINMK